MFLFTEYSSKVDHLSGILELQCSYSVHIYLQWTIPQIFYPAVEVLVRRMCIGGQRERNTDGTPKIIFRVTVTENMPVGQNPEKGFRHNNSIPFVYYYGSSSL